MARMDTAQVSTHAPCQSKIVVRPVDLSGIWITLPGRYRAAHPAAIAWTIKRQRRHSWQPKGKAWGTPFRMWRDALVDLGAFKVGDGIEYTSFLSAATCHSQSKLFVSI